MQTNIHAQQAHGATKLSLKQNLIASRVLKATIVRTRGKQQLKKKFGQVTTVIVEMVSQDQMTTYALKLLTVRKVVYPTPHALMANGLFGQVQQVRATVFLVNVVNSANSPLCKVIQISNSGKLLKELLEETLVLHTHWMN